MEAIQRIRRAFDVARQADSMHQAGVESVLMEASELQELVTEVEDFRMLSGGSLDDLQYRLRFQQQASYNLWRKNLLAQRLIDVNVDFIVGDGITLTAKYEDDEAIQEAIQGVLDDLWFDPVNDFGDTQETKATEMLLWGEVCLPVQVNEVDGRLRLGWICPLEIMDVHADPITGDPQIVELTDQAADGIGQKTLKVVAFNPETGLWEGDCFYARLRGLKGMIRGVPELSVALTWMNTLDKTLRAQADRAKLDANFLWDVLLKGKSDAECQAWMKQYWKRPQPGAVRVHNENAEIKAVSPNLGSADMESHVTTIRTHILGGYGFPLHWFGSGADANLATASVMAEPTRKALRRKQKAFRRLLSDIARFAIQRAQQAGTLSSAVDLSRDPFSVMMPDLSGPDVAKVAAAMQGVVTALIAAVDADLLSEDTAMDIAASVFGESGVEVDSAKEREAVKKQAAERDKKKADDEAKEEERLQQRLLQAAQTAAAGATGDPEAQPSQGPPPPPPPPPPPGR